jgi:hypothetical protein
MSFVRWAIAANAVHAGLEFSFGVAQGGGLEQHPAVEVGQEVPRALLGHVEAEDAKVLRASSLHSWGQLTAGLLEHEPRLAGAGTGSRPSHGTLLSDTRGTSIPRPKGSWLKWSFLLFFTGNHHTTGQTVLTGARARHQSVQNGDGGDAATTNRRSAGRNVVVGAELPAVRAGRGEPRSPGSAGSRPDGWKLRGFAATVRGTGCLHRLSPGHGPVDDNGGARTVTKRFKRCARTVTKRVKR